MELDSLSCKIR